jgi:polysaccharide pyruvyl transferase WcaK-like protein
MINILGWYGECNVGDDSFQQVFSERLSPKYSLKFTQTADPNADAIIFGGGGVLFGKYLLSSLQVNVPKYAIGVDIDLHGERWDKIQEQHFEAILVRSKEYTWFAREKNKRIQYCPDIAFGLTSKSSYNPESKTIGVILSRDLWEFPGTRDEIVSSIKRLSGRGYKFKFISLYNGRGIPDEAVNFQTAIMARIPKDKYISSTPQTVEEAFREIASVELLWTMRFHGVIFATITGTPFVGINRPGKVSLFCEQENLQENYLDLNHLNTYKLLSKSDLISNSMVAKLRSIASTNKELVDKAFSNALENWHLK